MYVFPPIPNIFPWFQEHVLTSANQGDSENGLQSPQLMAIGHTRYDGTAISQVKSQRNICDHEASSDSQFTMELTIGYNLVSYSNLS